MGALQDLTGRRFDRLVVAQKVASRNGRPFWLCKCDCGNSVEVRGEHLRTGGTRSCGCLDMDRMTTHGMSRTPTYYSWQAMKDRCLNPRCTEYPDYGGRGITICAQWINSFENFVADMGTRPRKMTIDRRDNNGNYTPENCRWATDLEQVNNRRNSLLYTMNGKTQCMKDWCKELGIVTYQTALRRMWRGWPLDRAILTPAHSLKCIVSDDSNSHS